MGLTVCRIVTRRASIHHVIIKRCHDDIVTFPILH